MNRSLLHSVRLDRLDGQHLDDDRGLQLVTRRKPKSTWTRLNRPRVADIEATGLMTDAGVPCGTPTAYGEVGLAEPPDHEELW